MKSMQSFYVMSLSVIDFILNFISFCWKVMSLNHLSIWESLLLRFINMWGQRFYLPGEINSNFHFSMLGIKIVIQFTLCKRFQCKVSKSIVSNLEQIKVLLIVPSGPWRNPYSFPKLKLKSLTQNSAKMLYIFVEPGKFVRVAHVTRVVHLKRRQAWRVQWEQVPARWERAELRLEDGAGYSSRDLLSYLQLQLLLISG